MISKGSRIYSVKEIREMCETGFSDELLEFYKRATESVKKVLWSVASAEVRSTIPSLEIWHAEQIQPQQMEVVKDEVDAWEVVDTKAIESQDNTTGNVLKVPIEESREVKTENVGFQQEISSAEIISEEESVTVIEEPTNIEETDLSKDEKVVEDEAPTDENPAIKKSPYADMEFGVRLDVDELWLVLSEEPKCPLDGNSYKTIQVMTRFAGTRKYSAMLTCCPECKRIYMKKQEFKEYLPIFKKKGIIHHIEEDII